MVLYGPVARSRIKPHNRAGQTGFSLRSEGQSATGRDTQGSAFAVLRRLAAAQQLQLVRLRTGCTDEYPSTSSRHLRWKKRGDRQDMYMVSIQLFLGAAAAECVSARACVCGERVCVWSVCVCDRGREREREGEERERERERERASERERQTHAKESYRRRHLRMSVWNMSRKHRWRFLLLKQEHNYGFCFLVSDRGF